MNKKVLMSIAAVGTMLSASAYTVEDLVVDNGYYVIENLYWSRADQMPNRYVVGAYQYPEPVLGLSKCMEFNYVRSASGVKMPYYVQATGLTVFNGLSQVTKNWNFKFANSSDITDIETDAPGIYLPNDQYQPTGRNMYCYSGGCSTDGTSLIQAMHPLAEWEMQNLVEATGNISRFYTLFNQSGPYPGSYVKDTWEGEITRAPDGYLITFGPALYWPAGSYSQLTGYAATVLSTINANEERIMHGVELEVFKPTSFFDATEYAFNSSRASYSSTGTQRHIPLRVKTYADGTFTVLNLMNNGYSRVPDDYYRVRKEFVHGGYDGETGRIYLEGGQTVDIIADMISGDSNARSFGGVLKLCNLTNFPNSTAKNHDRIYGDIVSGSLIEHRTPNNYWVSPGRCRTYITNAKASFGPFTAMNETGTRSMSAFSGGVLSLGDVDVTLNAGITGGEMGWSETQLWPRVNFEVKANDAYVESYTLYMVPRAMIGSMTDTSHEHFSHPNGHAYGYAVQTIDASTVTGEYPRQYYFSKLFNKSEVPAGYLDASDNYVFYVGANYQSNIEVSPVQAPERVASRASATLESTYHGLFTPSKTGVDNVYEDSLVEVSAGQGEIIVSGTESTVMIMTADGRQVYVGSAGRIAVAPGIYIVRAANTTTKVLVR